MESVSLRLYSDAPNINVKTQIPLGLVSIDFCDSFCIPMFVIFKFHNF